MKRLSKYEFLARYEEKYSEKYINDIPPDFYGKTVLKVTCKLHEDSHRTAEELLCARYKCRKCGQLARLESNRVNNEIIKVSFENRILQFKEIHGDTYSYPIQEFQNSHSKIKIICKIHDEFSLHMFAHIQGNGCPKCREAAKEEVFNIKQKEKEKKIASGKLNRINANKARHITVEAVETMCRFSHGEKFIYEWPDFKGKSGRVKVLCKMHGMTIQIIDEHIKSKHGCPKCANSATSHSEKEWLSKFYISNFQFRINLENSFIKVDGYDIISNTVYEYLGDYWHGHPTSNPKRLMGVNKNNKLEFRELFLLTATRFRLLKSMDYNIVYVWENDINLSLTDKRIFIDNLEY